MGTLLQDYSLCTTDLWVNMSMGKVDTITVEGGHTWLREPQAEKSKLFCFSGQRVAVDNVAAPTCGSSCHISSHWGLSSSQCSSILRCYSSPHCPSSCCSPRGPHSRPCQHKREVFAAHAHLGAWLMSQYMPIGVAYVCICVILVISQ